LLDPSQSQCLGCFYLNPLREYVRRAGASTDTLDDMPRASGMVTFWIRQDLQGTGLTDVVAELESRLPGEARPYLWFQMRKLSEAELPDGTVRPDRDVRPSRGGLRSHGPQ
jgi:hypothetical protein